MNASTSLPYVEPDIKTILTTSSFILLANVLNFVLDKLLYCGLIGQVLLGIAWCSPGSKWLPEAAETTIVQLGYVGLILLVYEGGLSTSFAALKANLILSVCVALTGISLPIALSFILTTLSNASYIQSFAAGASLCSTSLGTTLTVLNSSGLTHSRLGVVLTSAAMMDDVVGLVMVQVISNLRGNEDPITTSVILRPILVSLGFVICVPLACRLVARPVANALTRMRDAKPNRGVNQALSRTGSALTAQTVLLVSLITAASYAGTSNLFAAYLAGAIVSWWDSEFPRTSSTLSQTTAVSQPDKLGPVATMATRIPNGLGETLEPEHTIELAVYNSRQVPITRQLESEMLGAAIYKSYFEQAEKRILKPFFFASVGFSIPISKMFSGAVVWKGIIYTILMLVGKLLCGLWLMRLAMPRLPSFKIPAIFKSTCWKFFASRSTVKCAKSSSQVADFAEKKSCSTKPNNQQGDQAPACTINAPAAPSEEKEIPQRSQEPPSQLTSSSPRKPISLYSPAILGSAMVARGEIGFLISAIAQSNGIFDTESSSTSTNQESDIFLLVTWAIVLCTLLGPLCVGALATRVKKLERESSSTEGRNTEGRRDVLGVWGVQ